MIDKVKNIMSSIFEISVNEINETSSSGTIEKWDSLQHMNLIVSLEEEFDLRFNDEEIGEMLNFQLIIYTIKQKLEL